MKKQIILLMLAILFMANLSALTLSESITLAKQNNKELLSAKEDIIIADQTYYEVRGMLLPQVSLQGAYSLTTTWLPKSALPGGADFLGSLNSSASTNDSTLAGILTGFANSLIPEKVRKTGSVAGQIKLDQILFSGGKLINGLNAVAKYRSIQKFNYSLQEQILITQTTDMFYQTLLANKVYNIQQEALDSATRHLTRVELLNTEGQVSEYDLLRARLEVAKLRPNVVQAHDNFDLAMTAFRKQIGYADTSMVLEGEFILPETQTETLDTALSLAENQRIELKLSNINTDIMQIKYKAEKGNYLPNVGLTAGYSVFTAADTYAIEREDFGTAWDVGIGISIPIFTGFSNTARRVSALHAYQQAGIQEKNAQDMIDLEVKQAWQRLQYSLENYQVQMENIRLAERSVQLAQVRYDNQVGIQLEVFDAQMTLNSVKLSYYNSIYEVISANQKLKKAMGYKL